MKTSLSKLLRFFYVDTFCRIINKKKLLIVNYHGICPSDYCPPLFTHIPVDIFRRQLNFLQKHYKIISLKELINCLKEKKAFPERSAMITFDDGFMNNYSQAFPLLKEFNIPATIFLAVDYIGTEKLMWFDELFLLVRQAMNSDMSVIEDIVGHKGLPDNLYDVYPLLSGRLKRVPLDERQNIISSLKDKLEVDLDLMGGDFRLLRWEHVHEMYESGLIEFGVHTANHRIVSELSREEWQKEIVEPKEKLSGILDCEISSFCYPNGIPGIDFSEDHEVFLKKTGYICAFSTGELLNSWGDNPFRLGRIPAGNDMTSDKHFFPLNTSGFIETLKKLPTEPCRSKQKKATPKLNRIT